MTRAEMILALLREQPRTFDELVEATGLSDAIVRTALSYLRTNGYMQAIPTTYLATDKVLEDGKPKIDWTLKKGGRRRHRSTPTTTALMVEQSVRTNPNSVFAWGAGA
jgi:DNA-binding IclR family transcriptional regulator